MLVSGLLHGKTGIAARAQYALKMGKVHAQRTYDRDVYSQIKLTDAAIAGSIAAGAAAYAAWRRNTPTYEVPDDYK